MTGLENLLRDGKKIKDNDRYKNNIIDDNITNTKNDFLQYDGMELNTGDILGVDVSSYTGSTGNVITLSLDNGVTPWTTVKAIVRLPSGQRMPTLRPEGDVAYEAIYKTFDGTETLPGIVTGSTAYEILRNLNVIKTTGEDTSLDGIELIDDAFNVLVDDEGNELIL